ncbi:MAG: pyridoxamine 5'-phosphate oxidase family protein [Patescibacteria group bacterium]|nr:pyridoxamine 5'-phosphate oxidase family protein [Patescibacteria group bacterium]MDD4444096.1 pyridoxamine 5'-phosphate oxidase family protein [Patescibacteria group bacterium]
MLIPLPLKKFIEANALGLATVSKTGKPHNIAIAYVKVINDQVIISNAHIKESIKNLEHNNNVSLVIWNPEWEKSCVGFELIGRAKNYTDGKWLKYVKELPNNEGYDIKSAIVVKVKKIKKLLS